MNDISKTTDKRRLRGEASRKLIVQAAVDSIAAEGLGRLTLDRVAERVGISRGLVVFHFKSKKNLVEEVLQYLSIQYSSGWFVIIGEKDEDDISKLLRLIDYDIRFACENPKYLSAWQAFWGDSKGNQLFHELSVPRDEAYAEDMASLLAKISAAGGYDEQELPSITRGLFVMLFGIWIQLHLNPEGGDYRVNAQAVRLFLQKMFPNLTLPVNPAE